MLLARALLFLCDACAGDDVIKRVLHKKVNDCFLKYYLRFNVCGCGLFFSLPFKVCVCSSQWTATNPSWSVCRKSAAFMSSSNPNQIQAAWNFKACKHQNENYIYMAMDWRLVYVQVLDFAVWRACTQDYGFQAAACLQIDCPVCNDTWRVLGSKHFSGNKLRIAFYTILQECSLGNGDDPGLSSTPGHKMPRRPRSHSSTYRWQASAKPAVTLLALLHPKVQELYTKWWHTPWNEAEAECGLRTVCRHTGSAPPCQNRKAEARQAHHTIGYFQAWHLSEEGQLFYATTCKAVCSCTAQWMRQLWLQRHIHFASALTSSCLQRTWLSMAKAALSCLIGKEKETNAAGNVPISPTSSHRCQSQRMLQHVPCTHQRLSLRSFGHSNLWQEKPSHSFRCQGLEHHLCAPCSLLYGPQGNSPHLGSICCRSIFCGVLLKESIFGPRVTMPKDRRAARWASNSAVLLAWYSAFSFAGSAAQACPNRFISVWKVALGAPALFSALFMTNSANAFLAFGTVPALTAAALLLCLLGWFRFGCVIGTFVLHLSRTASTIARTRWAVDYGLCHYTSSKTQAKE